MSSTTAAKTCTILYDLSLHKAAVRFTYDDGPVKGLIASVNRKRQTVRLVGHTAAFESERIVGLKIDEDSHQSPRTIINCITPMKDGGFRIHWAKPDDTSNSNPRFAGIDKQDVSDWAES